MTVCHFFTLFFSLQRFYFDFPPKSWFMLCTFKPRTFRPTTENEKNQRIHTIHRPNAKWHMWKIAKPKSDSIFHIVWPTFYISIFFPCCCCCCCCPNLCFFFGCFEKIYACIAWIQDWLRLRTRSVCICIFIFVICKIIKWIETTFGAKQYELIFNIRLHWTIHQKNVKMLYTKRAIVDFLYWEFCALMELCMQERKFTRVWTKSFFY